MATCIFCKIASKDIPAHIVYEDDNFLGFLDIHPATTGHTLLIPKQHIRWVHDVEPFGNYWESARKIKQMLDVSLNPEWVQYFTHGAIDHAHIHIIPRYENVLSGKDLLAQPIDPVEQSALEDVAKKILQS